MMKVTKSDNPDQGQFTHGLPEGELRVVVGELEVHGANGAHARRAPVADVAVEAALEQDEGDGVVAQARLHAHHQVVDVDDGLIIEISGIARPRYSTTISWSTTIRVQIYPNIRPNLAVEWSRI